MLMLITPESLLEGDDNPEPKYCIQPYTLNPKPGVLEPLNPNPYLALNPKS